MSDRLIFTLKGDTLAVAYYHGCVEGRPRFGRKKDALVLSPFTTARVVEHLQTLLPGAYVGSLPAGERFGRKRLGVGPKPKPEKAADELRPTLF